MTMPGWTPKVFEDKGEVGSFDLTRFFVRVRDLEAAGKILAEALTYLEVHAGIELDMKVIKAMQVFGVEV